MADKPTAAFALSLIGAIFVLLGGLTMLALGAIAGTAFTLAGLGDFGLGFYALGALGLIWGIITLYGAIMINSTDKSRVRTGGILVLVFGVIISWFGTFGGFFIGFILCLIGCILALTWNPSTTATTEKPPAPPVPP